MSSKRAKAPTIARFRQTALHRGSWLLVLLIGAGLFVLVASSSDTEGASTGTFAGKWVSAHPSPTTVSTIIITELGDGTLDVQAYSLCHLPEDCDWGIVNVLPVDGAFTATYGQRDVARTLSVALEDEALTVSEGDRTTTMDSAVMPKPWHFQGTWINVDPDTRGITRMILTNLDDSTLSVEMFGRCHPHDCYWGSIEVPFDPVQLTARYERDWATRYLAIKNRGGQFLVESFTDFTPEDGRLDYRSSYWMKRR